MKKVLLIISCLISGCATIMTGTNQSVLLTSTPNANYILKNKNGTIVGTGFTPDVLTLHKGAGFFEGEKYTVKLISDGYYTKEELIDTKISPWYFGNLIFGGIIGGIFVDPITGSMWKFDPSITVYLNKQ